MGKSEMLEVNRDKLFHKDFLLVVIGQIISLFGNSILRFALPLYILDLTGSQALFGTILAISTIPTVLLLPFGGMISDRANKRNIMVILDFITAALVGVFTFTLTNFSAIWVIATVLILLSLIQAFYQPSVQASVPIISSKDNLLQSNAVVNLVTSLANLLGPVLGGLLYGYWGLISITGISAICFFISAVMEIFIYIPHIKQKMQGNIFAIVKSDIKESIHFTVKEKPNIIKITMLIALFNIFLSPMISVGIPIIVKMIFNLSSQLYGFTQSAMGIGGILGGIIVGALSKKLSIQKYYIPVLLATLIILPMGFSILLPIQTMTAYVILTVSCLVFMIFSTIFSVLMIVYIQRETSQHLLGKVMSFVMAGTMCAQPIGQVIYGFLFGLLEHQSHYIFFGTFIIGILLTIWLRSLVKKYE